MIHYTPLEWTDVWEEEDSDRVVTIGGERQVIFRNDRVERVISTEPEDFLVPQLQPGVWLNSTDV